jgi:2-polyprenyl-3-methyl-5-hydroxy-6-metoxy-1,4-benzoquinol methylase
MGIVSRVPEGVRSCWCGAEALEPFSPNYARCTACGTLVGQAGLPDEQLAVRDDETDYYGKRYWLEHQREELGLPDIYERARRDLPERCVHWLRELLRYRQPPGRVLEVGAGHGAYTALLRWAGYDATALDLSPWVAEFARSRFDIPYLVGPLEEQKLRRRSFDVVVANDVLEHLGDPARTMSRAVELLRPSGVLVIQTPEYRGDSYKQLVENDDLFLEHMRFAWTEHLYLFSREGLEILLRRVGLDAVAYSDPVYPYDMLCFASAEPTVRRDVELTELLSTAPAHHILLAMSDARDALVGAERDAAERLVVIERLDAALAESEGDRKQRLLDVRHLEKALKESEADREARLAAMAELDAALKLSEEDRSARLETMMRLDRALEESELDRAARLEAIEKLSALLKEVEDDRAARLEAIEYLEARLAESERDRANRLALIKKLQSSLEESEIQREAAIEAIRIGAQGLQPATTADEERIG